MPRKKKDASRSNGPTEHYYIPVEKLETEVLGKLRIDPKYRLTCREQVTPGELLQYMDADKEKGSISKGAYIYANRLNSRRFPNAREFAICRLEDGEVTEIREVTKTITRNAILTLKTKLELGLLGIFVVD